MAVQEHTVVAAQRMSGSPQNNRNSITTTACSILHVELNNGGHSLYVSRRDSIRGSAKVLWKATATNAERNIECQSCAPNYLPGQGITIRVNSIPECWDDFPGFESHYAMPLLAGSSGINSQNVFQHCLLF
jgi:hypothetical protein